MRYSGRAQERVGAAFALVGALSCPSFVSPAAAESPVYADGRDAYSLLPRRLVNRQLFEQLDLQDTRLLSGRKRFALAADLGIGTQQLFRVTDTSRYHGFFFADTFAAARLVDGLDANLNLLILNPSASDGYRVSGQIFHQQAAPLGPPRD